MQFKLYEFLEQFMIGAFLNPTRENSINRQSFNSAGNLKWLILRHFQVRIWRVLFTSLSADEFQLNSKSAY